jgi:hypothetical protein
VDAEPRSIRPFVLVATAFVMFGGVAGFMVWWLDRERQAGAPPAAAAADDVDRVALAPTGAGADGADARVLSSLVSTAIEGAEARSRAVAGDVLVGYGARAAPAILDAMIATASQPGGLDSAAGRVRVERGVALLERIRSALEPSASGPVAGDDPGASATRRTKAWLLWWRTRAGSAASAAAPGPK